MIGGGVVYFEVYFLLRMAVTLLIGFYRSIVRAEQKANGNNEVATKNSSKLQE